MDKGFIIFTENELKEELKRAFIHGQGNKEMMEVGLERDEVNEYVRWNIIRIKKEREFKK